MRNEQIAEAMKAMEARFKQHLDSQLAKFASLLEKHTENIEARLAQFSPLQHHKSTTLEERSTKDNDEDVDLTFEGRVSRNSLPMVPDGTKSSPTISGSTLPFNIGAKSIGESTESLIVCHSSSELRDRRGEWLCYESLHLLNELVHNHSAITTAFSWPGKSVALRNVSGISQAPMWKRMTPPCLKCVQIDPLVSLSQIVFDPGGIITSSSTTDLVAVKRIVNSHHIFDPGGINFIIFSFFLHVCQEHVEKDSRSFVFVLKACKQITGAFVGGLGHCIVWETGFGSDLLVQNG